MERDFLRNLIHDIYTAEYVYTALFVKDIQVLKSDFIPKFENEYYHHCTLSFCPQLLDNVTLGLSRKISVIGIASDDQCEALLVDVKKSLNKFPHITLSTSMGVPPVYSNEMSERAYVENKIIYFDEPLQIDMIEGFAVPGKEYKEVLDDGCVSLVYDIYKFLKKC